MTTPVRDERFLDRLHTLFLLRFSMVTSFRLRRISPGKTIVLRFSLYSY